MPKSIQNLQTRMADRLKLVFGNSVKIRKIYSGVVMLKSNEREIKKPLQALTYENGRLLLASEDRKYYVFVSGDVAAYAKKIYAERFVTSIMFNQPVTSQTDAMRIKSRYHYVPPKLIDSIIKAVAQF